MNKELDNFVANVARNEISWFSDFYCSASLNSTILFQWIETLKKFLIHIAFKMPKFSFLPNRKKEAELLEFTQKLTDKNVILQSDLVAFEAKSSALEAEHSKLVARVGELETNCSQTRIELEEERKKRKEETDLLVKKLAEKSKQVKHNWSDLK